MKASLDKVGMVTSKSLEKGTGKSWDQWVSLLDRAGARMWTHQEIVAFLKRRHKLNAWWQQGVTTGYEIAIGRRIEGQNQKGEYSVTATRTINIAARVAWKFLFSDDGLQLWLKPLSDFTLKKKATFERDDGIFGEVRTMKAGVRARLSWQDTDWEKPTILQVYVLPRPGAKCILVLQHEQLKSARLREDLRAQWKEALDHLATALVREGGLDKFGRKRMGT